MGENSCVPETEGSGAGEQEEGMALCVMLRVREGGKEELEV